MKKSESSQYDVLLIEDDLGTIRWVTSYFESQGVTCKAVLSGTKGLEELAKNPPKVVILDIILPDFSGYQICKKIKSNPKLKNIPVFLFPDISLIKYLEEHIEELKADGYIPKPFHFSDFDGIFDLLNIQKINKKSTKNSEKPRLTDEEIEHLDLESAKVQELIEQYKEETDKFATWRGAITQSFIRWLKGEKIYDRDREISFKSLNQNM